MHVTARFPFWSRCRRIPPLAGAVAILVCALSLSSVLPLRGETVPAPQKKKIVGATARITEVSSGLTFAARIDTGAKTSSIHTEKWEIKDPAPQPWDNVGKSIRFRIANEEGESEWIETTVASRVRMRSSVQDDGDYHGRYKVRLQLECNGVKKRVLVTLNDRSGMEYPLLIGRNFLRKDFLVDVDINNDD